MLQLMVVYFGPYYLFKVPIGNTYRFIAVIVGFVLNYAAYFAEIYRSGIESIPPGQREAAQLLGFTRGQTFFKIILPLAFVIGSVEMFTVAKQIAARESNLYAFVAAGLFYYIFNLLVAFVMERVEKKLSYYK